MVMMKEYLKLGKTIKIFLLKDPMNQQNEKANLAVWLSGLREI